MAFYETSAYNGSNIEDAVRNIASTASDQPTVPFFHEEVVQRAIQNYNDNTNEQPTEEQGGCACQLL